MENETEVIEETESKVDPNEMYLSCSEVTAFLEQVLMGLTAMAHGLQETISNVNELRTATRRKQ